MKKSSKDNKGLVDLVLSWKIEDVLNDDLYRHKIKKIPQSFKSLQHYFESYLDALLEETRAELSSSLEVLSKAPYVKLASIESKSRKFLFTLHVGSWKNRLCSNGKEPYKPLPGDVFIILDAKPESVDTLQCKAKTWPLAWLPYVADGSSSLKIQSSEDIRDEDRMQKELYLVFLANILTNTRVWRSLTFHRNVKIIEHLLSAKSMSDEVCVECSMYSNAVRAEKMGLKLSTVLNESQRAAVQACLCKMLCDHKSSVELIWGPPGTGKTKTVSMLLWTILDMKCRILVCAPTNVAITELASRVVKLLKDQPEKDDLSCPFGLGDLLLFGNKDRLKLGPELEDIYLDYRVDRLMECLGAQKGWRYCVSSLIKLLEESCSLYHEFLEQKQGDNGVTSFLGFMREQFETAALELRQCLQILHTHLPSQLILEHNLQRMNNLVKVDWFGILLCSHHMVSEELEDLFSRSKESRNNLPNDSVYKTFFHSWEECLSELKDLLKSLARLPNPNSINAKSVEKFIYQKASMVFCTASSSFKLNSKKIEPIDMLIIDEAAQLKECESTIPLQLPGIRHAILIGDEFQLPAIVNSKVSEEAGFGRSLFERLSLLGHQKHLLNVQYRMHPSVSCFPNSKFYANQILNAPSVMDGSYEKRYLRGPLFGPFSFINVAGGEERNGVGTSFKNMAEVAVVVELIKKLHKEWSSSKRKITIGVISPYTAQIKAIQDKLRQDFTKHDGFTVKVKSVDGFQGGEEDVIVISAVRSNSGKKIGFLSNPQRINVALTRARHCLWILGDERTLRNGESDWGALIHNAKDRRCFFNADEDEDLANALIEAKIELLQFDDLLIKDSILFKKARWKVLFSNNFRESFLERLSISQKKSIMVFLLRLSGGWRPDKSRFSFYKGSHVLKHVKVEGLYMTYSIDIQKDSKYIQVLKIWDIKPLEEVHKLDKCIFAIYNMYTDDFLSHCTVKCQEGNLEVPLTWSASSDIIPFKDNEKSKVNCISSLKATEKKTTEQLLQMRFQSLSYQKMHYLLSGCEGKELDLPGQVSDQQFEIIIFPKSSFIIGRPGAAKTSCLTIKMLRREQRHSISWEGSNGERGIDGSETTILRQLFITVTSKQCLFVKQHLSVLKSDSSRSHGLAEIKTSGGCMHDLYDADQFSDSPNSFLDVSSKSYPLVMTYRKFLMMLDRSIGDSYFRRFHKLFELPHHKSTSSISTSLQNFIRGKEVNCNKFASSYWPNFERQLTRKLDAFLVFNEIVSQIKGGFQEREAHDSILSRKDYTLLFKDQFSTVSKKQREKIYDIFLDYEKRKTEKGEYDLADLVIDLNHRLRNTEYLGEKMDFLYLDEVQDLSMRQISLFKFICRNCDTGVVFSANTAQTIARFDFRFHDIRLLFYKEFLSRSKGDINFGGTGFPQLPDIFHLNQNLQTQPKVLRLAQSIMDLLFRFFPSCVDILSPETSDSSVVDDEVETPILLVYENNEVAFKTTLKESVDAQINTVNLGPEQVILVRDDLAREKIINLVGNQCLVLTIMECQCLEFSDVFLYDFFGSSLLERHWNVVYEYMQEQSILEVPFSGSFPSFNHEKYKNLCWELKLLYVAITRSRKRLWICEDKQRVSHPIFDYWKKLSLVQVSQFDKSIIETVHGSKEEWNSRGLELFSDGIFGMASMCFQMAEDIYREKWAKAASLRVAAENMTYAFPESAQNAFQEASDIFNAIGMVDVAAQCLVESREYEKAATLYLSKCGEDALEDVGDCYTLAECYEMAANIYSRGKHFSKFIYVCTFAHIFDMGLQHIQQWGEDRILDVDLIEERQSIEEIKLTFLEKGALHYNKIQNHEKMMNFVRAFDCMDSKRSFLRKLNRLDDLLILEKEKGNFVEAANIAMKKGNLLLEIDLLEEGGHYRDASSLLLLYVYFKSLWDSGEQGWPLKNFKEKEKLLTKAKVLAMKESYTFYDHICTEANILSNHSCSLSDMTQCWSYSLRHGSLKGIILSTWQILDLHLSLNASKYHLECIQDPSLSKHAEEIISQNKVSFHSLFYFWNIWMEKILDVISHLGSLGNRDCCDYSEHDEFCLRYFCVRKYGNGENITYLLLNSGAAWIMEDFSHCTTTNLITVDYNQFILRAKNYWYSEIISVSMKVVNKFTDIQKLSIQKSLSPFFLCSVTVHIYKVCQLLTSDEYLKPFIDCNTLQKIFGIGLESIQYFRKHQSPSFSLVDNISHAFLLKCALHYHKLQDVNTMLKFVRAFYSVGSRHSFFKEFGYCKELLALEIEDPNYTKAIAIAKSKGDLILEVDLLEKSGFYKDASSLVLLYVCFKSLWASEEQGWPLKKFKKKEKLLKRAKLLAMKESDSFYERVGLEANILSNHSSSLSDMTPRWSNSLRHGSLKGIIMSTWQILDLHLSADASKYYFDQIQDPNFSKHTEESTSQNKVTFHSLLYFWTIWLEKILEMISRLGSLVEKDGSDFSEYEESCLGYFGVRKEMNGENNTYLLLNSKAAWIMKDSPQCTTNLVNIDPSHFIFLAKNYWYSEILSVGMKVLKKFTDLQLFSIQVIRSPVFLCYITSHVYKMCQFLTDDESLKPFIDSNTLQKIFDIGLDSIQYFRKHRPSGSLVHGIIEVDAVSNVFLLKCVIYYQEKQDANTMLKFVRALCSVESRPSFLKGFGHSKELALELDDGKYAEAVAIAIAKSAGDLLLEVNFLDISGQYKDASLLLLSYVFANSLWSSQSEGWPLKEFKNKEQLLDRAKSLAKLDSDSFYEAVHAEANILSNRCKSLSMIAQDLKVSECLKSFRGIVLSCWKILDAHFLFTESNYNEEIESVKNLKKHSEATISQNKVSAETLMYFWKSWKDNMVKIFDYLSSFGTQDATDSETYETFCLSFLGVRKQLDDELSVYQLINLDAKWVREVDSELGSIERKGDVIFLNSRQFVSAAWNYWSSEVLSVWTNVLEKLKSLYFFSVEKSFSELRQCTIAIYILQLVEFSNESKFERSIPDGSMISRFSYKEKISCSYNVEDVKQFFQKKFDLHYHKLQDSRTMMKTVNTFDSMNSKRLFFKSLGCDNELSSLKGKSEKFLEGITAARLNGELFEEVDLLHAEGQHKEAAKLILIFVLANSLWGTTTKGWPLKPFEQRKELLSKAKSYAKHHSSDFYNVVCTEARILYEMTNQLTSPPKNSNITVEILSARKIIDAHFHLEASKHEWGDKLLTDPKNHYEDKLSNRKLSFETLVYYWNVWKEKIVCIIKFFECVESKKTKVSTEYEESALKYLGVREWFDDKTTYQLLIPDADWVRHLDESALKSYGDAVTINARSFAIAAKKFWIEDLISVSMEVLKHLVALQMYAVNNYASVFHQVSIHVVEVANFLKEFRSSSKFPVDQKVSQLLQSSLECFLDCVFLLNWIKPMTQNMVALRETGFFTGVFEAVILKIVSPESKLTNEKIGKVVMAVLGSKKLNDQTYKMVSERLAENPPWKAVIDECSLHASSLVKERLAKKKVKENPGESLLIFKLHKALIEYYSKWRKEINPISPNCFLYIIERHFILVSRFQECFYATRSSFVEWLVCDESSSFTSQIKDNGNDRPSFGEIYDFIANMTHQFLSNDCGAREWIKRSNIDSKDYYPLFLLRLVILMCLLCTNSEKYHDMLHNIVNRNDIVSRLPAEFNAMLKKRSRNNQFIHDLAEVLWKMKNPLLKLYYTDVCNKAGAKKCIGVRMKNFQKKEDILGVVFENNDKQILDPKVMSHWKPKGVERNASTSSKS